MKLYLPLSSKNFNNLFTVESVSPFCFYADRGFGIKFFDPCSLQPNPNVLVLYSQPFNFGDEFRNIDEFPMWLEFDRADLENDLVCLENNLFVYPKTIYFRKKTFRCIFRNEQEKNEVIEDSVLSATVKTVQKYVFAFEKLAFFAEKNPKLIQIAKNYLDVVKNHLPFDSKFNQIKGFLYGYALGGLTENVYNTKRNLFNEAIQILSDKFTGLPSLIKMASDSIKINSQPKLTKTTKKMPVFFGAKITYDEMASKTELQTLLRKAENTFENLGGQRQSLKPLESLINAFFSTKPNHKTVQSEEIEEIIYQFRNALYDVKKEADDIWQKTQNSSTQTKILDFQGEYPHFSFPCFANNENETKLLNDILTHLWANPRANQFGNVGNEDKAKLIAEISKNRIFKRLIKDENNSTYKELNKIYHVFSKSQPLDYNQLESIIFRNFAYFLQKMDKFSDLIEFANARNLENKKIAFAFWGAYNGFAAMYKTDTKVIVENEPLSADIDKWLFDILAKLPATLAKEQLAQTTAIVSPTQQPVEEQISNQSETPAPSVGELKKNTADANTENVELDKKPISEVANEQSTLQFSKELSQTAKTKKTQDPKTVKKIETQSDEVTIKQLKVYASNKFISQEEELKFIVEYYQKCK